MYSLDIPPSVDERLANFAKSSPSINNKLQELVNNPEAVAVPTGKPAIGDFYVNAGRYAITFDINHDNQSVQLLSVVTRPYLHKLLTGKIQI
jgi:mRNA-degrading endonuclease RelE of RelBE toxin-antitoxin system